MVIFREWVEVKINKSDKWFVASNYCFWKALLCAETVHGTVNWKRVPHNGDKSKPKAVNEIELGNYKDEEGDVSKWTRD